MPNKKQASEKAFTDTYTQANRQAQSRGMQRSSYNNAVLGNIGVAGAKSQADIGENQSRAIGGVEDQRTLLAQQLAGQIRQYSSAQAADTLAYIDELESKEYDRGTQAQQYENSLASQIYQFANQEKTQNEAQQNWLTQFNQNVSQFDQTFAQQGRSSGIRPSMRASGSLTSSSLSSKSKPTRRRRTGLNSLKNRPDNMTPVWPNKSGNITPRCPCRKSR